MYRRRKRAGAVPVDRRPLVKTVELMLTDWKYCKRAAILLLFVEMCLCAYIIRNVAYTEIDWKAYMQQAEQFLSGIYDYGLLRGDTGPLVYPAGHAYIYSLLYMITGGGEDIRLAQYIFWGIYMVHIALVFLIYNRASKVPPYVLLMIVVTSYRIHSIFLLRLFNDCIAMTIFYLAVSCWLYGRWTAGIIAYSLALSVKMNILLFAPAVATIYLLGRGLPSAVAHAALALFIQVALAAPFLQNNAVAYLKGAFNFGRVFEYKWTVNWRFLSPEMFVNPYFHVALLACHVSVVAVFLYVKMFRKFNTVHHFQQVLTGSRRMVIRPQEILLLLAGCNTIGIAFSRSLHYQFYEWYYHLLHFLFWRTPYPPAIKLTLLGVIEICWNVYPSEVATSLLLHICHFLLLIGLFFGASVQHNKTKKTR